MAEQNAYQVPEHVQGLRVLIDDREFVLDRATLEKSATFANMVAATAAGTAMPEVRLQRNVELFNQALSFMRGLSVLPTPALLDELRFLGVSDRALPAHVIVRRKGEVTFSLKEDLAGTCEQLVDLRENEAVKLTIDAEEIQKGTLNDLVFVVETLRGSKDTWVPLRPPKWTKESKSQVALYHFAQMRLGPGRPTVWTEKVEGPARVALHLVRWSEDGHDMGLQVKRFFPSESDRYPHWKFSHAFQPITSRCYSLPFTVRVEVQMQIAYDSLATDDS